MLLPTTRLRGTLAQRYKRFLADILLANGQQLTVHCPNSGSMRGCSEAGSPVIISLSDNPRRKHAWTLEMVGHEGGWIGVNTARTNGLIREALEEGLIDDFGTIRAIRQEVVVSTRSRIDFLLETERGNAYLEIKHCSLAENGVALFPDAITARGTKHLLELAGLVEAGFTAVVLFCVQRRDAVCCKPAITIDPVYAQTACWADGKGVRFLAYQADVQPHALTLTNKLAFNLS
jgi:sugar fermentation stimulation protein A